MKPINLSRDFSYLAPIVVDDLIRLGASNDGGYVVRISSILESNFLLGLGLSDNWKFEEDFKKINNKIKIHCYDPFISPKIYSKLIIKGLIRILMGSRDFGHLFLKISALKNYYKFFPRSAVHFREKIVGRIDNLNDVTIGTAIKRTKSSAIFLKIDIEGSEYEIVEEILNLKSKINSLVIEFHDISTRRIEFEKCIRSIQEHFALVHLHANNYGFIATDGLPDVLEITFSKLEMNFSKRTSLPLVDLDAPNAPSLPDIKLLF